ncbi:MAG: copper amine oxidase N-terminal domain-containing protein, partial [Clostridiales bacterium]|nr:copper amine oxidase N-terminal domain-containing protein [Clostridiales bacterium]
MKKKIISTTMCLLLAALFSLPVVAQNITKNISATYRGIKIFINSKEQGTDLEPFIYNNSTYVPLRFVSEKMNASVDWDDKTNTISITTENAT